MTDKYVTGGINFGNSGVVLMPLQEPTIEPSAEFIFRKLAEWFDCPCNWSFGKYGAIDEYMLEEHGDWCEKHCPLVSDAESIAKCWRKLFEGVANENQNDDNKHNG